MRKRKKTRDEIQREVARISKEIQALKRQAQKQRREFWCLDEKALARKLRGETANSPYIYAYSQAGTLAAGSSTYHRYWVGNPDPQWRYAFLTKFHGLGAIFELAQAWIGRDTRWPEFSAGPVQLPPEGSGTEFNLDYTLPANVPSGIYHINAVLWGLGDDGETSIVFDTRHSHVKVG